MPSVEKEAPWYLKQLAEKEFIISSFVDQLRSISKTWKYSQIGPPVLKEKAFVLDSIIDFALKAPLRETERIGDLLRDPYYALNKRVEGIPHQQPSTGSRSLSMEDVRVEVKRMISEALEGIVSPRKRLPGDQTLLLGTVFFPGSNGS